MSITDRNGNDIIRLSTLWAWSFKLLLLMTPIGLGLLWTWGLWITGMSLENRADLRILKSKAGVAGAPLETIHALDRASLTPPRLTSADSHEPANTCP